VVSYGPFSDTTTIALIARAANQEREMCGWLATACSLPHKDFIPPQE
jgi:hypothetical protein